MQNSAAFLSLTEEQVMSVPIFRSNSSAKDSETSAIFDWVRKGVSMPFNTFENGNRAVFLGAQGKLYEWGVQKAADGTTAKTDPKDILSAGDEWKLQTVRQKEGSDKSLEEEDLSATAVVSTETETYIVDPQMQLFMYQKGKELTRCLANHRVSQVACGAGHVLVLMTDGVVHCAGQNNLHQLGQGNQNPIPVTSSMQPIKMPDKQAFATYVACGSAFSIILCNNNTVYCFGSFGGSAYSGTPRQVSVPEQLRPCVKVSCGKDHALFMTAKRRLAGLGLGNRSQLGKLSVVEPNAQSALREISWDAARGEIFDVFCHPRFNASVVLSKTDKFYVCGEVGELLGKPDLVIDDFHGLWSTDAVVLQGTVVCMKPPTGSVRSRGFNDEETSDVQLVPAPPSAMQEPSRDKAAEYLGRPLNESHRRLCSMAFNNGKVLSPQDIVKEFQAHDTQNGRLLSTSTTTAAEDETELRVFLGEETIKQRSRYLKKLISEIPPEDKGTKKNGDPEHEGIKAGVRKEKRKLQISIPDPGQKFSKKTLHAYGQFLYEDDLKGIADAPSAIDMLVFAREIGDDLGIVALSAWHAKHHINPGELASCLRKCIDSRYLALGVEFVKLRLCLENCCDVLQVAEMAPEHNPYAEYIRAMAMAFAAAHAKAVVQSQGFKDLDNVVKGKLLEKLAAADCLKT